jgi:hypothetical protein
MIMGRGSRAKLRVLVVRRFRRKQRRQIVSSPGEGEVEMPGGAWGETPPGKPPTRTRHPEVSSGTKTDFQASPAAKASGVHEKKPFAPRIPEREREHPAVASGQEAGGIHHNNFLILPRHAAKMTLETARHCAAVLTCNINEKQ